jgi:hypothetical protein
VSFAEPTLWTIGDSPAVQDAGGRLERAVENAPEDGNGHFVPYSLLRTVREVGPPAPVQAARAVLADGTVDPGDARVAAASSMRLRRSVKDVPRLYPQRPPAKDRLQRLQEWEGTVLDLREDSIRVRLVDKTNGGVEEEAEILLDEISRHDLPLIKRGAVFYWTIGYHDSATGQRTRQSIIVFRRLPAWSKSELEAMRRRVRSQSALFRWV